MANELIVLYRFLQTCTATSLGCLGYYKEVVFIFLLCCNTGKGGIFPISKFTHHDMDFQTLLYVDDLKMGIPVNDFEVVEPM